jgi:hypothetical protein
MRTRRSGDVFTLKRGDPVAAAGLWRRTRTMRSPALLVADRDPSAIFRDRSAQLFQSSIMRQESRGGSGDGDFSVVLSLFLRRRKTRKIEENRGNCSKIVQGRQTGHLVS